MNLDLDLCFLHIPRDGGVMEKGEQLDTIWEVPDDLWEEIEPIIWELDPPKYTGRKRANPWTMLNGIIHRMRSGCQWNQLPKDLGDDSTIHRTFHRWEACGLFPRIWTIIQSRCDELVVWTGNGSPPTPLWVKPVLGDLIGPNPTDQGQAGTKRSLLVEAQGGPLSVIVAEANIHDTNLLAATIEAIVVERPEPTVQSPQNLCLDKAYDNPTGHAVVPAYGYQGHIRRIGEEKLDEHGETRQPARRWVVERTLAWLAKCRAILVRYDKKPKNYLALLQLACALIWYRCWWRLRVLR
jgi:putative transposase